MTSRTDRQSSGGAGVSDSAPVAEGHPASQMASAAPGHTASGAPAGPIASRDEAYRRLREVAEFLRKTEPHSPVPPLLDRAVRWGNMSFEKLFDKKTLEIVSAHGVPPRIVGIITAGSLGGGGEYQAQLKSLKEVTIRPKQVLVEETFNDTIFRDTGDRIDFNEIDITPIQAEPANDTEEALFQATTEQLSELERGTEIVKALVAVRNQLIENGTLPEFDELVQKWQEE